MSLKKTLLLSLGALALAGPVLAECGLTAGSVRILSNDFEALRVVNAAAGECAGGGVTVSANATTEHKNLQVPALSVDPAQYTVAMVANNSIVPLMNDALIRPLDDLVAAYGQQLEPNQLIKINGKVMAIAFMANGQHLMMRKDLLAKAGVAPPKTWEEVLTAAKALKAAGVEHPLGAADLAGWELAAEFVNMYLGHGGEFFVPGTATLAIDNDKGVATLEMMRALTAYMSPDYLTYDSDILAKTYEAGQVAIMNNWGSLAGAVLDPANSSAEQVANTEFAAAPTVAGGAVPAAALWWDGFAIAAHISDADAEASFRAMMHATSPEVGKAHADAATWLIRGVEPAAASVGVIANARGGAKPYPMVPAMGLLHEVLGTELADFMKGTQDAKAALARVDAAYAAAATQAGFLK